MDREIDKRIKKAIDDARAYLEDLDTFISRTKTHLKKNGFCVMGGEIDRASGYERAREDVSDLIDTLRRYESDQDPTDCAAQVRAQIDQLHLDLETLATQVVGNVPRPWEFIRVTTAIGACRQVLDRLENDG